MFSKFINLIFIAICCACSATQNLSERLQHYVNAANTHDLAQLEKLMTDDVVWRIGNDTLSGIEAAMGPLSFDKGANTVISVADIQKHDKTLEFLLVETNNVLAALGISQLVYNVRFVYRGKQIAFKEADLSPAVQTEFISRVMTFAIWLQENDPVTFKKIWSENWRFNYSEETAKLMVKHIERWNVVFNENRIVCDTVQFISKGFRLDGYFFSSGVPQAPTLLFTKGFMDKGDLWDIGKTFSSRGINVFEFDFRGCHGSEGTQSLFHGQEDLDAAIRFLKSDEQVANYQLDTGNFIAGGFSYGGHMSMLYAIHHPSVKRVISISGGDLGIVAEQWRKNPMRRKSYRDFFETLKKPQGPISFKYEDPTAELIENADSFSIMKSISQLIEADVLLISGVDDRIVSLEDHMLPLYRALKNNKGQKVRLSVYSTGHDFTKVAVQLLEELENWIKVETNPDR